MIKTWCFENDNNITFLLKIQNIPAIRAFHNDGACLCPFVMMEGCNVQDKCLRVYDTISVLIFSNY